MNRRLVLLIFVAALVVATCGDSGGISATTVTTAPSTTSSTAAATTTAAAEAGPCLPEFASPESIGPSGGDGEPFVTAGDFDGDGDADVVITRLQFATHTEFEVEVYLNEDGRLEGSDDIFVDGAPSVQHPTGVLVADFNGDGRDDIFVSDHGYDASPHPGYQNTLILSTADGRLRDATAALPQQLDFTHSAAAGDIDGDSDMDLFIGNVWGGTNDGRPPEFWLNDGTGRFTVERGRIPADVEERNNGGYLIALLADLDGDEDLDLVLGDSGDDLALGPDSIVLLNDGSGRFSTVADAIPPKDTPTDGVLDIDPIDVDGDGAPDLVLLIERYYSGGGSPAAYVQVLHNEGSGVFTDVTDEHFEARSIPPGTDTLEFIDLDVDGDLDAVVRPWDPGTPDPLVWTNDEGRWSPQDLEFGVRWLYYDFLDFDGDGDLDLVNGELQLLENVGCG